MTVIKHFILFQILALTWSFAFAQGEIDPQEKILFQNERSIIIAAHSNGFGVGYRFGKRRNYLNKVVYDIELASVRHPKEVKISAASSYPYSNNKRFVYGKTHFLFNLRPSIGFQRELFSKEDQGSIAIKFFFSGGPSIGITKPAYYVFDIWERISAEEAVFVESQTKKFEYIFETLQNSNQIKQMSGRASFWHGMNELKIYPGLHAKAGFNFEYSSLNRMINALEVGAVFDAFGKKIPILYSEYNSQFYLALYVGYRFGWVVNTRYKTPKITTEGELLRE
jgi:hypothetical protein